MLAKNTSKLRTEYKSLEDLNLISLWWQSGSDWTSTIKEEIQADTNRPIAKEESSNYTNKVVLFAVLATLALSVATVCSEASEIYRSLQKVGINSFKELISKD